jgi:hypothetical protein
MVSQIARMEEEWVALLVQWRCYRNCFRNDTMCTRYNCKYFMPVSPLKRVLIGSFI